MKKHFFLITLVILCFSIIHAETPAEQPTNYNTQDAGTESNPYLISNLANLRWLSEHSEDWWIDRTTQVHFSQINNIDAQETINWNNGKGFKPIGDTSSIANYPDFTGVYDGNGYTINNLYINTSSEYMGYAGLFARISGDTILRNIGLVNNDFTASAYAGGLVGDASTNKLTIYECYTTGNITAIPSNPNFNVRAGGLVGAISGRVKLDIYKSYSTGNITSQGRAGGLVGDLYGSYFVNVNISESFSTGNISTTGGFYSDVGGIFGSIVIASEGFLSISNCFSTSEISASASITASAGGIIGLLSTPIFYIINSYSTGNISAYSGLASAGGIVGEVTIKSNITLLECYSEGDILAVSTDRYSAVGGIIGNATNISQDNIMNISDCYSIGSLTGVHPNNNSYIGGIAGLITEGYAVSITNCYAIGSISEANNKGGVAGFIGPNIFHYGSISNSFWDIETTGISTAVTYFIGEVDNCFALPTEEMKQESTFIEAGWDFENVWDINPETNNGFPFLRGETNPAMFQPISNLTANVQENDVILNWQNPTGSTSDFVGYNVYRDNDLLTPTIITDLTIQDHELLNGVYVYRVIVVYKVGQSNIVEIEVEVDDSVSNKDIVGLLQTNQLHENYPNPFNPETTIKFFIVEPGDVSLDVFNIRGQLVRKLIDDFREQGEHQVIWNGLDNNDREVSSGVYFYRLNTAGFTQTKRMVLLK